MDAQTQRTLRPGRRLLIQFPGNGDWFERIAVSVVSDYEWFLVQPNGSMTLVNLAAASTVKLVPAAAGRPPNVLGTIHSFGIPPSTEQRKDWLEEGALRAEVELERRAKLPTPPTDASKILPSIAGGSWLCLETCPLYEAGSVIPVTTAFESVVALGRRALGRVDASVVVGIEWVETAAISARTAQLRLFQQMRDDVETGAVDWGPKAGGDETPKGPPEPAPDARLLDVKMKFGRRHRDWQEVAEDISEIAMADWPIEGPRSALWVARFLADSGRGGPEAYHKWWRVTAKLGLHDWGVSEHMQNMRFLHLAGTYDQLDLANLAIIEAIARRIELIEYQYRERTRDGIRSAGLGTGASPAIAGALALGGEEADLFDGVGKVAGGACVAPQIVEFVAQELEKSAKIDKQARKARDEKVLMKITPPADTTSPPGDGGKGDGKGGRRR